MDGIIELRDVSKIYRIYAHPGDRLKELATLNRRRFHKEYGALRDLSLEIRRGETFCVIGENGSGKSTLLQIIAGILEPTAGTVSVHGRVTALLELGSGFNPEFTGRENVQLNGAILGFTSAEIEAKLESILHFAEIGSYFDQPVRTYSSGMAVRLAFSVAVHLEPDVLIVDEALAVGDICFRQRCMRKIHELRDRGVTIVYVTHDTSDVKALGHRTLWLEHGRAVELGDSSEVVENYLLTQKKKDAERMRSDPPPRPRPVAKYHEPREIVTSIAPGARHHGEGTAEVIGIQLTDDHGRPVESLETPASLVVRISVRALQEVRSPIVGFLMRTPKGVDFAGTNTAREGIAMPPLLPGQAATVDFRVQLPELAASQFTFTPAVADGTLLEYAVCDSVDEAASLEVVPREAPVSGYMRIPCKVSAAAAND